MCTRLRAIAVFIGEIFGHALGKAALAVKPRVDPLQTARPGQPLLAANLVPQAEHQGPVCRVFAEQARRRSEALCEQQNFGPAGTRPFVVVDKDWTAALTGPGR